jgi:phospholipase/carboxylesterase
MREIRLGSLSARVVGGTDREGGGEGPVLVLLHGFGAPADDLVSLYRVMRAPREMRWVFPGAPLDLSSIGYPRGSRAWWPIDMMELERAMRAGKLRDLSKSVPDGLPAARDAVIEALDAIDRELHPSAMILGGFSQGAMLALDVALRTTRPLAGLALMSGTLLCEDEWAPLMAARAGTRVVQSHGREDPLLPFSLAERLAALLQGAGWQHELVSFRGGHEIPPQVLERVEALIGETT